MPVGNSFGDRTGRGAPLRGSPGKAGPPSPLNRPPKGPDSPPVAARPLVPHQALEANQRGKEERQPPLIDGQCKDGLSGSTRQTGPTGRKRPPTGAKTRTNRPQPASGRGLSRVSVETALGREVGESRPLKASARKRGRWTVVGAFFRHGPAAVLPNRFKSLVGARAASRGHRRDVTALARAVEFDALAEQQRRLLNGWLIPWPGNFGRRWSSWMPCGTSSARPSAAPRELADLER